jgi:hypothetical protein
MTEPRAASLDADAARALEQGSFARFRRSFATLEEAFNAFAASQSRRYPLPAATASACCACGGADGVWPAHTEWDFQFPSIGASVREVALAVGHVHVDRHRHARFATFHPVCSTCWRRWWAWRVGGSVVQAVGGFAVALGAVFGVLGSIFYVGGTFGPSDRAQMPLWIAGGLCAMVLGIGGWVLGLRWRIPAPLRRVAGRPVMLEKLERRDSRLWDVGAHLAPLGGGGGA